jgi:serine/threonine protein kinase
LYIIVIIIIIIIIDPNDFLRCFNVDAGIEQSNVISFDEIEKQQVLGEGSYGVVYKAVWRGVAVAVKEVKGGDGKDVLISEVIKMQHLRYHLNIVRFCGITRRPLSLVVEFCGGGT